MGDSACLVHGYSNPSVLPNEFKQGNPMHALGDSISFGRFMTESLSWEKWSTFSHKKYVEEAESYSQPGSVAQKKAFFEAHYKRIAAQKAAALLEEESAANNVIETEIDKDDSADYSQSVNSHLVVDEKMEEVKNPDAIDDGLVNANEQGSISMAEIVKDQENDEITVNEYCVETHLKKSSLKKRLFPKSLRNLFNFIPIKQPNREPNSASEKPKNCITPLKTTELEPVNGVAKISAGTPCSETRWKETPTDPSAAGSKTTRRKRHIFSAISKSLNKCWSKFQSASLSNPSIIRTEETAAERKKKLEEKFKANAVQKGKLQNLLKTPAAESQ